MFNKNVSYINRKKQKKAGELPSELVEQILSRLPSKSLLRWRSVCKSWLSLISSSQFILMHLHNFNQLTSRRYLVRRFMLYYRREEYAVHFDDQQFTLDTNFPVPFPYNFHLSGTEILFFRMIGCYNGVICFSSDTIGRDEIILWNPSIRKILTVIPSMYPRDSPDLIIHLGFGYHEMSDDYKVIRLAYHRSINTLQVQIYTVKTAIWRALEFPRDLPPFIFADCSQVFLNGSVHWVACDYSILPLRSSILTFDMTTELFGEIQFPESLEHQGPTRLRLAVVGDSLAMIYSKSKIKPWWNESTYKIWAMKEYKNPMSWTMIYKVYYPENAMGIALGVTSNGDLITVGSTEGDVTICNQEECYSVYGSRSEGIDDSEYTFVERYQESLALLDVGSDNDIQDDKELHDEV